MASWLTRLQNAFAAVARSANPSDPFYSDALWSSPSATGISINQQTALQATAVMACVSILSEDVSKMTPQIYRRVDVAGKPLGGKRVADDHPLYNLLWRPNDWQTWPEFCRQMVIAYLLRGNGYAVILRNGRGDPVMLVPINPDRVMLWQSPDGSLFWMVTRSGLHELAILRGLPLLIPYDDVFHLKDLSADGLVGMSRIALAREAIAIALGQEQQQARMMGQGARPSGMLSTDQKLTQPQVDQIKQSWMDAQGGLINSGKTAIMQAGLKWTPLTLTAVDLQFLQLRQFQLSEIARLFRVPMHMIGDLSRGTFNNITQQSQEYRNNALTSHTDIWEKRFDFTFNLRRQNLFVDFDESTLLKADLLARYTAYRMGRLSGWLTTNNILLAEGMDPVEDGDELIQPMNMEPIGSDITGAAPDGAGKKSEKPGATDDEPVDVAPGV